MVCNLQTSVDQSDGEEEDDLLARSAALANKSQVRKEQDVGERKITMLGTSAPPFCLPPTPYPLLRIYQ